MTQITRKSSPTRGMVFLLALFLGAGLALSGCGDDDAPATPAPAPPPPPAPEPEPEPPAPEAPSVPTGLAVSATTETSITYSWNAVEGASGYEVQFSLNDEDFDDPEDLVLPVAETSFTNPETTPLAPGTTAYLRVRAVAGEGEAAARSAWSTHVTGSTDTPAPPVPDPVMASFSLPEDAESPYFLVPDGGTDEETATASVNSEIVVTSNTDALIAPLFAEDASGVRVSAGENLPFALVDWEVLQSAVVEGGATFRITRVTVGANQEMEASGDIVHVTCGPFGCASGMEPPEVTIADSAACEGWDPSLTLEVGMVDNDGQPSTNGGGVPVPDGYDLGWVYSSSVAVKGTHAFGDYTEGSANAAKGSDRTLPTPAVANGRDRVLSVAVDDTDDTKDVVPCEPSYDPAATSAGLLKPRDCFRVHTDEDYLSNYEVTLAPQNAGVRWGAFSFDDLACPSVSFAASDQVDVCSLFEAEVEQLHPPTVKVRAFIENRVTDVRSGIRIGRINAAGILTGFDLDFGGMDVTSERYTAMWYHDGTKPLGQVKDADLRRLWGVPQSAADPNAGNQFYSEGVVTKRASDDPRDGDGLPTVPRTFETVWVPLVNRHGEPIYGDLGKSDARIRSGEDTEEARFNDGEVASPGAGGDDNPENFGPAVECTADDGGEAGTKNAAGVSNGDGTLCDAEDVEIETTVVFTDNLGPKGSHACSVEKTYTITCDWDASGGFMTAVSSGTGGESTGIQPRGLMDRDSTDSGLTRTAPFFLRCEVR